MKDYIPKSVKLLMEQQKRWKSQFPSTPLLDAIDKTIKRRDLLISAIPQISLPQELLRVIERNDIFLTTKSSYNFNKLNFPDPNLIQQIKIPDWIKRISENLTKIQENPEIQFSSLTDFEILNVSSTEELKQTLTSDLPEEDIEETEELLEEKLIPVLERFDLHNLWLGANQALASDSNPDKLRHCLISLRTILEYLIDHKLAPKSELKDSESFRNEFKQYHSGKKDFNEIKNISRKKKIQFFTSKIDFSMIDFTINDVEFICECYSVLCNIHEPDIGISENKVRSLKVKTGITIWFLSHIYELISLKN